MLYSRTLLMSLAGVAEYKLFLCCICGFVWFFSCFLHFLTDNLNNYDDILETMRCDEIGHLTRDA